jgi:C1A family cysteine protease
MSDDTEFNVNGFIPEPDSDKHWSYEDKLKSRMVAQTGGDVDLRPFSSPRHNQRSTSSCVANAVVKALEIKRIMQGGGHDTHTDLSRMAVYYLARELMFPPKTHVDGGTYISHACDVLRRFGVCTEADWPWDFDKINEAPSWAAMRKAYVRKIESFYKIRSVKDDRVAEVVRCLQAGNPVVFGTTVGRNWSRYKKGQVLECPVSTTGRHATVLVGWRDGKFIGENSWGSSWGDDGFYLMDPKVIACNQAQDFWVIQGGWEDYGE